MPLLPVALFGLEVPCGDVLVPATPDFPATFRITMAAIDPSEPAELEDTPNGTSRPRATLKLIRQVEDSDDEDDEDDEEAMRALLAQSSSDEDSESDEEANGGPSDPSKSKKARKQAALEQLIESLKGDASDEDMEDAPNGIVSKKANKKGKAKATSDDEESEDESDDGEDLDVEEFVLCTLDPEKNYQQPLDITVAENERVYFKVTGTHTIYLTGNYVIPDDDGHNHHHEVYDSDDDEDYDLSPDEDELDLEGDESDDLDDLPNPRVTEVDSEDEAPALVKKADKKGKNKRSADEIDAATSLDDIMAKSLKSQAAEEPKLSKKQLKKLKKNNGEAVAAKAEEPKSADPKDKSDKKVQFAKNLEQGPTGSEKPKAEAASAKDKGNKGALGVKNVGGVTIDDKKLGKGPACKKGNRVSMRYIGKLADGKVFDSNKSGKPFSFKLGAGEVIQGWDIGVAGMSVGGERRLIIPAKLAYGSRGQPGIPANSNLTFDVKLLEAK
ncbi:uncharacterized protein BP5553_07660 [Venustampulla echinocandica]|uniref:peptidylprolyl isomerase n=1 Tax=Venustampulla echinocandica TaxID=2656787 RepID=A0A370TH56_9HELO|nr:uncharacterized protein BP5553_07660 [Venustampulla echinocandica]RDL34532.1 hypothetical protein BP5553_07660 [Venustampulla echinocandica]